MEMNASFNLFPYVHTVCECAIHFAIVWQRGEWPGKHKFNVLSFLQRWRWWGFTYHYVLHSLSPSTALYRKNLQRDWFVFHVFVKQNIYTNAHVRICIRSRPVLQRQQRHSLRPIFFFKVLFFLFCCDVGAFGSRFMSIVPLSFISFISPTRTQNFNNKKQKQKKLG